MFDSDNLPVGPGFLGFLAVFVLAVALWLLMRNMNSRMRRMAYRERDRLEQEQGQAHGQPHGDTDGAIQPDGPESRPGLDGHGATPHA